MYIYAISSSVNRVGGRASDEFSFVDIYICTLSIYIRYLLYVNSPSFLLRASIAEHPLACVFSQLAGGQRNSVASFYIIRNASRQFKDQQNKV